MMKTVALIVRTDDPETEVQKFYLEELERIARRLSRVSGMEVELKELDEGRDVAMMGWHLQKIREYEYLGSEEQFAVNSEQIND